METPYGRAKPTDFWGDNEAVSLCRQLSKPPGGHWRASGLFVLENPDIFQRLSLPAAAFFPSLSCFSSCATPRSSSAFLFIMQTCTQPPSPLFFIHHVHEPRNPSTVDDALSICSCRAGALARSHALTHTLSLTHSQCVVSGSAGGCISPDGSIHPHAASCYTICIV